MDAADQVTRQEEIHVAHMQGRRARSYDKARSDCDYEDAHLVTAWEAGYDERDRELDGHPEVGDS